MNSSKRAAGTGNFCSSQRRTDWINFSLKLGARIDVAVKDSGAH